MFIDIENVTQRQLIDVSRFILGLKKKNNQFEEPLFTRTVDLELPLEEFLCSLFCLFM